MRAVVVGGGVAGSAAAIALRRIVTGRRFDQLAKVEASSRDAKTAGPFGARMRELIMPHVFGRFYERAVGWTYDFDPGTLPRLAEADLR